MEIILSLNRKQREWVLNDSSSLEYNALLCTRCLMSESRWPSTEIPTRYALLVGKLYSKYHRNIRKIKNRKIGSSSHGIKTDKTLIGTKYGKENVHQIIKQSLSKFYGFKGVTVHAIKFRECVILSLYDIRLLSETATIRSKEFG